MTKTGKIINEKDFKGIIQTNSVIIRQIYRTIVEKNSLKNVDLFYRYVFSVNEDEKKLAKQRYNALVATGYGDISMVAKNLARFGISKEFFTEPVLIKADKFLINTAQEYLMDSSLYALFKEEIINSIFDIKNLDDSLIIDSIQSLVMFLRNIDINQNKALYDFTDALAFEQTDFTINQQQLHKYLHDTIEQYKALGNSDIKSIDFTSNLPDKDVALKNIFNNNTDVLRFNLFFLREVYSLFVKWDGADYLMDIFYIYLGITEKAYQEMLDNPDVEIPCTALVEKLKPYKFPATLFRGSSPSTWKMSADLQQIYDEYSDNLPSFRQKLKLQLCYICNIRNMEMSISVYALVNGMKEYLINYLPDNREYLENGLTNQ